MQIMFRYILLGCLPRLRVLLPVWDLSDKAGRGRLWVEVDLCPGSLARLHSLLDSPTGEGPESSRPSHSESARASEEDVLRVAGE